MLSLSNYILFRAYCFKLHALIKLGFFIDVETVKDIDLVDELFALFELLYHAEMKDG
jgi:hypothetical protein